MSIKQLFLGSFIILSFLSCNKDNQGDPDLLAGKWNVTMYYEQGAPEFYVIEFITSGDEITAMIQLPIITDPIYINKVNFNKDLLLTFDYLHYSKNVNINASLNDAKNNISGNWLDFTTNENGEWTAEKQ